MSKMEDLLSEFSTSFYKDDFTSLTFLHSAITSECQIDPSLKPLIDSNIEYQKFQEDSQYFDQVLSHLRSPDWQPVSTANEIIVESLSSGLDFYTKASVLIYSNILQTLSVLNEADLLPSWIHALSQVDVIDSTSKLKKLMKYQFWFPWPLTNRECFIDFSAYPISEEQSLMIIMRSPSISYLSLQIPEVSEAVQRMVVPLGCILIKPILPSLTQVTIMAQANSNTDFKPTFLPEWLLEFGKKQMMYFLMDSLRITVHNFEGSEYENRVQNNSEFYNFLKVFIHRFLDVVS